MLNVVNCEKVKKYTKKVDFMNKKPKLYLSLFYIVNQLIFNYLIDFNCVF